MHYGIDRVFEKPHTIVYFNMGAARTQVTIVRYDSYSVKEAGKVSLGFKGIFLYTDGALLLH